MSMRDEYRTKAAEFQARASGESDRMTRLHFESLARDYEQLAELAEQVDTIYKRPKSTIQENALDPLASGRLAAPAFRRR